MVAVVERTATNTRERVERALHANPLLGGFHLGIEEAPGSLILTGAVDCCARKREAESTAAAVAGESPVLSEIRIGYDAVNGLRDFDLLMMAPYVFESHYLLRGKRLNAIFEGGHAILTGRVETLFEKAEAERVISVLSSLRGVENRIVVQAPKVEPDALRGDVEDALGRVLGRAADRIEIEVIGPSVLLAGPVQTQAARLACVSEVSKVRGVTDVIDGLRVDVQ